MQLSKLLLAATAALAALTFSSPALARTAEIDTVTGSGNSVTITEVWSGTWMTGWTHIVPISHNGAMHLLFYRATTGYAWFGKVNANGQGLSYLGSDTWTTTWTAFSPLSINGVGHVLGYKISTGKVATLQLNPDGSGIDTIWSDYWTTGWA